MLTFDYNFRKQQHANYVAVAVLGPLAVGAFFMARYHARRQVQRQAQLDADRLQQLQADPNDETAMDSMSPLPITSHARASNGRAVDQMQETIV